MSGKLSIKRRDEIRKAKEQMGVDAAAEHLGISRESVKRVCRKGDVLQEPVEDESELVSQDKLLLKIRKQYSDTELKLLARGGIPQEYKHTPVHDFSGRTIRVGWFGDTHIGSVYTNYDFIREIRETFAKAKVDMVVHTGDLTEGMSNRPGHIYECSELGFDAQKERAVELMSEFDWCPLYMIDGNHDRWYIKSNGALIVKDVCDRIENAEFLGHDEGDIVLTEGVRIKLWHGEDGSSYAHSYRPQKLIESLQGGNKPHAIFAGHVHKFGYFFDRNIHFISTGCVQKQSKWMRGKRLPAHVGFGIADITVNEKGIGRFTNTFYPFYA